MGGIGRLFLSAAWPRVRRTGIAGTHVGQVELPGSPLFGTAVRLVERAQVGVLATEHGRLELLLVGDPVGVLFTPRRSDEGFRLARVPDEDSRHFAGGWFRPVRKDGACRVRHRARPSPPVPPGRRHLRGDGRRPAHPLHGPWIHWPGPRQPPPSARHHRRRQEARRCAHRPHRRRRSSLDPSPGQRALPHRVTPVRSPRPLDAQVHHPRMFLPCTVRRTGSVRFRSRGAPAPCGSAGGRWRPRGLG